MPSLTLNLRQAHTMSQGGVPVKHEDPAELQRWHELVAQVGRELAGPLTTAMERLNTWSTTGQVDRAGLRALKEEVDQSRALAALDKEAKAKLKSVQFGQQVVFWKWISATKLGLVTATSVYHWDMQVRSLVRLCRR